MDRGLREAIRADFGTFHRMAFRELNHGKKLSEEPYLDVLRHFIASSEKIRGDRALVNLPPRHLKSFTISVCFPMWLLGRNPSTRIMLVGNSEALVKDHARQALALMGTSFYHESFPETRLPKGHGTVMNFGTTAGGQIRAVPVNGTITGFGAEFIIADDLCHLTDAARPDHLSATNEFLSNILQWRLNDPERGNMIVVEHRIDRDDVSGQMLRRGGCRHLKLPLIATEPATYPTANGVWNREVGELLRPSAWSQAKIDAARESCVRPDFETVFQQNPANGAEAITKECFPLVTVLPPSTAPVVINVDCAQTDSSRSSYSVALVWCPHEDHNVLLDLFRDRCRYRAFRKAVEIFIRRYRPSRILIERTGIGPALRDDIAKLVALFGAELVDVPRPNHNKTARLVPHIKYIASGGIRLPARADFVGTFIEELVNFPNSESDIVDSTTQYLDDRKTCPVLKRPAPQRVVGVVASKSAALATANSISPASVSTGVVRTSRGSAHGVQNSGLWGMPTPIEPKDTHPVLVAGPTGPRWKLIR